MTLAHGEFIRRFLIHVLPGGFHRIRHYGLFANGGRADNLARVRSPVSARPCPLARVRQLLGVPARQNEPSGTGADEPPISSLPCPCCGGRMIVIETFERGSTPRSRPTSSIRIDTS